MLNKCINNNAYTGFAYYHYLLILILLFLLMACDSSSDNLDSNNNSTSPAPTPPTNNGNSLSAGSNLIKITQDISGVNVERNVHIKTPASFNEKKLYPVVFVFHGAGGNANIFVNNPSLSALIDNDEFIGVFPQGHANNGSNGGFWNLGTEPTDADDLAFVDLIMAQLANYSGLDLSKRYAIGFSNGAGMSNLLAKSTSYFNAIAPLFSQQTVGIGAINSTHSLSVFQVNGATDGLIPLNGGTSSVGEFMSAENSALNWVNVANCATTPVSSTITWGGKTIDSKVYSNCDNNHQIQFLVAQDTGHGWQDASAEAQAYNAIWAFFQNH